MNIVIRLLVGLLSTGLICAQVDNVTHPKPLVPYEAGCAGINLFTFDGRESGRLGPRRCWEKGFRDGYISPVLHPSGEYFASIKCRFRVEEFGDYIASECTVVKVALPDYEESIVFDSPLDLPLNSLAWTNGGSTLAFFVGSEIVAIDPFTGSRLWSIETNGSGLISSSEQRLGRFAGTLFSNDGVTLAVCAQRAEQSEDNWRSIGRWYGLINGTSGDIEWVCCEQSLWCSKTCEGEDIPEVFQTPAKERPWQSAVIGVSADGRYQYYKQYENGWFSKSWLKAYDRNTGKHHKIKRLSWSIYSK